MVLVQIWLKKKNCFIAIVFTAALKYITASSKKLMGLINFWFMLMM
jgi:hypothetical protein